MRINHIHKIFLLSFSLLLSDAIAQETAPDATTTEKNLPEITSDLINNIKQNDNTPEKSSALLDQAKDGLASVLLGNKINSLMLDDQENGNLDRAIDAFKNNQAYVPDDGNEDSASSAAKVSNSEEEKRKAAEKLAEEIRNRENEKSYIYLASIIYFSPKDWIIWINEKKITSKTNDSKKELYVESIKAGSAKIIWKLSLSKWRVISGRKEEFAPQVNAENQIEIRFELKPNQTFMLSSGSVAEGKALIALLKKKEDDKKVDISAPVAAVTP